MDNGSMVPVYMPMIIIVVLLMWQQRQVHTIVRMRRKRKKGLMVMTNQALQKMVDKTCRISFGTLGSAITGKILSVTDQWMEVETKKGLEMVNAEYVQNMKVLPEK